MDLEVRVRGVTSRDQHDAIEDASRGVLLHQLARLDLVRAPALRATECSCAGNAGSGGGASFVPDAPQAPPEPITLTHEHVALPPEEWGKVRFHLPGLTMSAVELQELEGALHAAVAPELSGIDFGVGAQGVAVAYHDEARSVAGLLYGPLDVTVLREGQLSPGEHDRG